MKNKSEIIVGGYSFFNSSDANLAETERKKVEYLRKNLNTSDPEKILAVYKKAVNDRMFKTPVGTDFLKEMQVYLIDQCDYTFDDMPAIPITTDYDKQLRDDFSPTRRRVNGKKDKGEKVPFIFVSVVLNILLVAAVVAMFVITLNSDQPNILNYETALVNKYSYWEQDLSEREQLLRDKEREIKLRE